MSANSQYLAFASAANNLVASDTNVGTEGDGANLSPGVTIARALRHTKQLEPKRRALLQ